VFKGELKIIAYLVLLSLPEHMLDITLQQTTLVIRVMQFDLPVVLLAAEMLRIPLASI